MPEQVAHGKYLVEAIAGCNDCHSQHDERGQLVEAKRLKGSPLLFKPTVDMPGWAATAPAVAGLPGWTEQQGIEFLMTGKTVNGVPAGPPMPEFRMNREDAAAVVAYLKSLK